MTAAGTFGSEVLALLGQAGEAARGLVRSSEKQAALEEAGCEAVIGDLERPESLPAALDGVSRVLLVTPSGREQVATERNVVEAASEAGVEHLIKLSVVNADPESRVAIYRSHGESERHLQEVGLPWTVLRSAEFMQNFLLSAPTIAAEGTVYGTGVGSAGVSMIDVRDLAAVAVRLLRGSPRGETLLATGPDAPSFGAATARLGQALGRELTFVELAPDEYRAALVDDGVPAWVADAYSELYQDFGRGSAGTVTDTVDELTGRPARPVEEFGRDHRDELLAAPG